MYRIVSERKFKILFCISVVSIALTFITMFNPSLNSDEAFSMALVHHSYSMLIYLNSFDVHPPLYYLILKIFLSITTFWTSSILVKIMFARLLSMIFFIITVATLRHILDILCIKVPIFSQLLLYLMIMPTVTLFIQIRMYELAIMFISLELMYLIKFNKNHTTMSLIMVILSATLAAYTHYFSAMFAGSLLLVYLFKSVKNHNQFIKLLCSIISFIILFIPCMKFAIKQFLYVESTRYSNMMEMKKLDKLPYIQILSAISGINFHSFMSLLLGSAIDLLLGYLTIFYFNKINIQTRHLLLIIIYSFLISLIVPLILSVIGHPIIQGRYYYPITSIYEFLLMSISLSYITCGARKKREKIICYIFAVILLLFSVGNLYKAKTQFNSIDLESLKFYKNTKHLSSCNELKLNGNKTSIILYSVYMEDYNIKHKPIFTENSLDVKSIFGSDNKKLMNKLFNNVNIHYKK